MCGAFQACAALVPPDGSKPGRRAAAKREAEGVVLYVHVPCLLCVYTPSVHVCARVIIINVDFQKPGNGKQNTARQRSANGKKIVAQQQRLQRPQRRRRQRRLGGGGKSQASERASIFRSVTTIIPTFPPTTEPKNCAHGKNAFL